MNKEKIEINAEDVDLLKEMKNNCLNSDVYDDEKRLLKSNAITKFLNLQKEYEMLKKDYNIELDDNFKLSGVWLKSQERNKTLKKQIEIKNKYLTDIVCLIDDYNDCVNVDNLKKILVKIKLLAFKGYVNKEIEGDRSE